MRTNLRILAAILLLAGCDNLPGDYQTHSTVIGDPQGASGNPLGATGAYVCGVSPAKEGAEHRRELVRASHLAEASPASAASAQASHDADLNRDGFVTLDEIIAMRNSGLSDLEIISRLKATGYRFTLTRYQEQFLRDRGVGMSVVRAIE